MNLQILFITSHYFYPLTLAALERIQPECRTKVVCYDSFSQIPHIYRQHQDECDAVFLSGISAKRVLEIHCGNIGKPVTAFQVDSDGLHRDILRFAVENQSLDFSRVAMDFLLPLEGGYSVTDFLALEDIGPVFSENQKWMHNREVQTRGSEEMILERIVELWQQKNIDCVICMYSGNIPRLQQLGIPWRCPFLSDAHLKRLIRDALIKIELQNLHNSHPAIIQLFPAESASLTEEESAALEQAVRNYLRENLIEAVVQPGPNCCSLISSLQVVRFLTDEFRTCRLRDQVQRRLNFPVISGYGIGTTISHAMNNAQIASREAKMMGLPFAVDSNGNLIGPLNAGIGNTITQAARMKVGEISKVSSLSAMTIRKLLLVQQNRGTDKITVQELADSLNTSVRNANRIMQNLIKGGFAAPVYTQTSHSRGRPVQVYVLNLQIPM